MYSNILVPVVLNHEGKGESAISVARSLLDSGGELTLLHVVEDIPGYAAAHVPEETKRENQEYVASEMHRLAAKADGDAHARAKVMHGHPSRAILDYAEENQADCIVIASHKPGLEDYLLGSTAARVVRHAQCAVHVIR